MFEPDKYPGLDDYYEEKHRAVLVERGEVIMYLHCRFSYCEYIVSSLEKYINCACDFCRFLQYFVWEATTHVSP